MGGGVSNVARGDGASVAGGMEVVAEGLHHHMHRHGGVEEGTTSSVLVRADSKLVRTRSKEMFPPQEASS